MLDLGRDCLMRVPDAIGDLEALTDFLYLHDNRLESLLTSLARLLTPRYLNVSNDNFSAVPECICAMSGLIELRASDNQLSMLPDGIGALSRFRELHLRNNRLTGLPDAVGQLREFVNWICAATH